jgi:hypothetical protein
MPDFKWFQGVGNGIDMLTCSAKRKFTCGKRQPPDVIPAEAKSVMAITSKEAWAMSSNLLDYPEENGLK